MEHGSRVTDHDKNYRVIITCHGRKGFSNKKTVGFSVFIVGKNVPQGGTCTEDKIGCRDS
jgi:hypothetical protein